MPEGLIAEVGARAGAYGEAVAAICFLILVPVWLGVVVVSPIVRWVIRMRNDRIFREDRRRATTWCPTCGGEGRVARTLHFHGQPMEYPDEW